MKKAKVYVELKNGSVITGYGVIGTKFQAWIFSRLFKFEVSVAPLKKLKCK